MSAPHILFVETEGNALQRLMLALNGSHREWRNVRVADSDAALDLLARRVVSVVFTNFGDNHADGDRFLGEVRKRAPAVVRYALLPDHHDEQDTSFLEHAYQCFPHHCTFSEVEAAIDRGMAVWLKSRNNPKLTSLLADLEHIPTPPQLYFEIREELNSPDSNARSIAGIISRDPALSAKILKVANSGFYAIPRSVTDIQQAITILGTFVVTSMVLATNVFERMPVPGINLDVMWKHSLTVSALAQRIAKEKGGDRHAVNAASVAGLLHDIGELTLLSNVPELYRSMMRCADGDENVLLDLEREQFGVCHPELGAYVLGLWSLPDAVVDAVALHHDFTRCSSPEAGLTTKAVFTAECLLRQFSRGGEEGDGGGACDWPLDVPQDRIEDWRETCAQLMA